MSNIKKRDDEKAQWLIVGILFTVTLLGIDFWYSSYSQMAGVVKVILYIAHTILAVLWLVAMVKFKDPNYEVARKYIVYLAVLLSLIVAIHHATVKEDKHVIIDSRENSLR